MSRSEAGLVLDELAFVNRWMGGISACRSQVVPLLRRFVREEPTRECVIVDLGAGGADLATQIAGWAREIGLRSRIIGIDFNHTICRIAADRAVDHPEIQMLCADVHRLPFRPQSCDLVVCSAFLHHFSNSEVIAILRELSALARGALVVNDLQRSLWAWIGIYTVTRLLSWSKTAQNDGPLSVQKGFHRKELTRLAERAGLNWEGPEWHWAFRYAMTLSAPARGYSDGGP